MYFSTLGDTRAYQACAVQAPLAVGIIPLAGQGQRGSYCAARKALEASAEDRYLSDERNVLVPRLAEKALKGSLPNTFARSVS